MTAQTHERSQRSKTPREDGVRPETRTTRLFGVSGRRARKAVKRFLGWLSRLWRSNIGSVLAIIILFFSIITTVVMLAIYFFTTRFVEEQVEKTIETEVLGFGEAMRDASGKFNFDQQVLRELIERRSKEELSDRLYLLTDENKNKIEGNLPGWPEGQFEPGNWYSFTYSRSVRGMTVERPARAQVYTMQNGDFVLVGRDTQTMEEVNATLGTVMVSGGVAVLALCILIGFTAASTVLTRIERINRTSRDIMDGDLSQRVPVRGVNDEFDQLADSLNAMLDQIERLLTAMREVTDNVAHDLRSPLTRLRNRLEVTLMRPASEEEYQAVLGATIADADHLLQTFNALLSIARVEAGASRDNMVPVEISDVIRDVSELYEPVAEDKEVGFSLSVRGGGVVLGKRELLSQAAANLMDNAIKYTPRGGRVSVVLRTEAATGDVLVEVSDTGPGIPEGDRERVMKRFVRLEASRSLPGSGLGLSLVSAVARMHDGRLELGHSSLPKAEEGAHPGLRATLRLPLMPGDEE